MAMDTSRSFQLSFVFHLLLLLCLQYFALGLNSGHKGPNMATRCKEREREALLTFKQQLKDDYGRLSSWGRKEDQKECCKWSGISCSNRTGHVIKIDLPGPSTFSTSAGPLRGKLSPSLLELKHLNYLDLSNNDFGYDPIPNFIGSFTKLQYLNLFNANFGGITLPTQLGNLSNLRSLSLGDNWDRLSVGIRNLDPNNVNPYNNGNPDGLAYFPPADGWNPLNVGNLEWLSHLSSLTYLKMGIANLRSASNWLDIVSSLSSLSHLDLKSCILPAASVGFPAPPPVNSSSSSSSITNLSLTLGCFTSSMYNWLFNFSSSLVYLDLHGNELRGQLPNAFGKMTSLSYLDLSSGDFEGVIPNSFGNLANLQWLYLDGNNFSNNIPATFGNMTSLLDLHLYGSRLEGVIPNSLGNLRNLQILDLSYNPLEGEIPKSLGNLQNLQMLDLSYNQLEGEIPKSFKNLRNLQSLDLCFNNFSGDLPDLTGWSSLTYLFLANNQFNGTLTETIGQLSQLEVLDLSFNSFKGSLTERHLSNLTKLLDLSLSFNPLSFQVSSQWLPPFQLQTIILRSCKLGPHFPKWLQTQRNISFLDLSNASISDPIPPWFLNLSTRVTYFNLSFNQISGTLPELSPIFANYCGIDLSSNQFEGPLPTFPSALASLNLSKNKFSGTLSSICKIISGVLSFLDLSMNRFSGVLPDCWVNFPQLVILNFAGNNLSGNVPTSMGSLSVLEALSLRNNSFSGGLPSTLQNCKRLIFLDLGVNNLSGEIPSWMGEKLSKLNILSLRSNKFSGIIPSHLCHLSNLRILDLSCNEISGVIPKYISNFTAMTRKETESDNIHSYLTLYLSWDHGHGVSFDRSSYVDSMLVYWKGREFEFKKNLEFLRIIDLSNNMINGKIPEGITDLSELVVLNLSRNNFDGAIPQNIGQLKSLECLDLSSNKFSGGIPASMSEISFLNFLNLSHNELYGKIPLGTQLQSFDNSSYKDNAGLCGPPLALKCPSQAPPTIDDSDKVQDDEDEFGKWLYIGMGIGFATGFWGVCGALLLYRPWRHSYFRFLDFLKDWIYVKTALWSAKLQWKSQRSRN